MKSFSVVEAGSDIEHLNTVTASHIETILVDLASKQEKIIFGLCGGRSVGAIFELLSHKNSIPWNKIHFFMVDERLVTTSDAESNYKLAADVLINPLKDSGAITEANCHPFILDKSLEDFGVGIYSKELSDLGGKFDLAILSGGEDGHIGAIYPNHHSYHESAEYYIHMTDSPKPPPQRMSASKSLILRTQNAILLVLGEAKADLYANLSNEAVLPENCPAKLVAMLPNSYLITTHKD